MSEEQAGLQNCRVMLQTLEALLSQSLSASLEVCFLFLKDLCQAFCGWEVLVPVICFILYPLMPFSFTQLAHHFKSKLMLWSSQSRLILVVISLI